MKHENLLSNELTEQFLNDCPITTGENGKMNQSEFLTIGNFHVI